MKVQTNTLVDAVTTAIDDKAWDSGHVTGDRLKNMLGTFKADMMGMVKTRFEDLKATICDNGLLDRDESRSRRLELQRHDGIVVCTFTYDGRMWDVPKGYRFVTSCTLRKGWNF